MLKSSLLQPRYAAIATAAFALTLFNVPVMASQAVQRFNQAEQRDAYGRLTVEASVITIVNCNSAGENGGQYYIYQYVRRAGVRAIRPPYWARPIGGRDWATYDQATAAACGGPGAGGAAPTGAVVTGGGGPALSYFIDPKVAPYAVSSAPLQSGVRYVVEVSGTFSYWGPNVADSPEGGVDPLWCYAKWRCPTPEKWQSVRINEKGFADFSGQPLTYNPQHVYRIEVIGGGVPVRFDIFQGHYNMIGGINIRIYPR